MSVQAAGAKRLTTTIEEDIWATSQLSDPALTVWLNKRPAKTGDAQLDSMIQAEMDKVQGFPLKRVSKSTSVDAEGAAHSTTTEVEVIELKIEPVADSEFKIPAGYVEIKPMRPQD